MPRVPAEFQDYVVSGDANSGNSHAEKSQKKRLNEKPKHTSCSVYRMDYDHDEDEAGELDYFDEESMDTAFVARDKTGRFAMTVGERLLEEQRADEALRWKNDLKFKKFMVASDGIEHIAQESKELRDYVNKHCRGDLKRFRVNFAPHREFLLQVMQQLYPPLHDRKIWLVEARDLNDPDQDRKERRDTRHMGTHHKILEEIMGNPKFEPKMKEVADFV